MECVCDHHLYPSIIWHYFGKPIIGAVHTMSDQPTPEVASERKLIIVINMQEACGQGWGEAAASRLTLPLVCPIYCNNFRIKYSVYLDTVICPTL